ncbi:MAG: GIY-YIG nuclease family protein [Leptotrichiaceae bacterium]|jgi:putative endonuclease|nr:GIY-YIG nuclease family protein [Leptotrichiaceae bacterium]MBP6167471.1 GIY-YIG nuclease family protein [Leptotrichiaceae bacterium]MBP7025848.1 GIY-YIG nuclease family protein [Leptotrichiaceae bacterium]MBP8636879.1 GIY-YIG nuclease family protein [Leptotrichiaceae bacterium]MBP9538471.1 GIY-YIG nuclease family protein [Leptotrichiaceae bacterium]
MEKKDCVYILECNDGTLYTGWTNDIDKRFKAHNDGKGAKYTKGRRPLKLVYLEELETKSEALKRENEIKKMTKDKKRQLIK